MPEDPEDPFWDPESWIFVGVGNIACPYCGELVPFDVQAQTKAGFMALRPVLTDVWAHAFTHEGIDGEA